MVRTDGCFFQTGDQVIRTDECFYQMGDQAVQTDAIFFFQMAFKRLVNGIPFENR